MNRALKAKFFEHFSCQKEFARAIGIAENRVSRIIHGRSIPRDDEKTVIAKKLKVPLVDLFPA